MTQLDESSLIEITPETDEALLVALAQQGLETAFAELMRRNVSTSLRLAISVLRDREEAEDQVQTSFLKAWQNLKKFKLEARFSTWMRVIVRNQSLMRLRSLKQASVSSLDAVPEDGPAFEPPSLDPTPENALMRAQMTERLNMEMSRLPVIMREILVLRDMQQLSTEATAARLGISEPAAKSRLNRARAMLRERMERHMGESSGAYAGY